MSNFLPQRSLFEVREAPSKMYSWPVFLLANVIVEMPFNILLSAVVWASWYFPVFGMHQTGTEIGLMFAFTLQFLLFAATFAQMLIFTLPTTETAASLSTIMFTLTLQFNGVLQPPPALPGFWIFMYRVSPFTYLIGGWAGTGLADRPIICAENELAVFDPPDGQNCGTYLERYLSGGALGTLLNPAASQSCEYCPARNADQILAESWIYPSQQYRNLGIMFAYIAFNIAAALTLYYIFRVKRFSVKGLFTKKVAKEEQEEASKKKPKSDKFNFGLSLAWNILRNTVR